MHRCLAFIVCLPLTAYSDHHVPNHGATAKALRGAIEANPADYPAWQAHGEQQLKAGNLVAAKQSYVALFNVDRQRAGLLMETFDVWIETHRAKLTPEEREFIEWVRGRKRFAEAIPKRRD